MPRASLQSQQDRRALHAFGMKQEVLPPKKIPARCGPWSHLRGCPNSPRAPTRRDDWTETSSLVGSVWARVLQRDFEGQRL